MYVCVYICMGMYVFMYVYACMYAFAACFLFLFLCPEHSTAHFILCAALCQMWQQPARDLCEAHTEAVC